VTAQASSSQPKAWHPAYNKVEMPSKLTRRAWAATLAAAPAALAQAPAAPPQSQDAAQWLDTQRKAMRRNLDRLNEHKLPQTAEPAFRFEA
jgi:hypothetical protein